MFQCFSCLRLLYLHISPCPVHLSLHSSNQSTISLNEGADTGETDHLSDNWQRQLSSHAQPHPTSTTRRSRLSAQSSGSADVLHYRFCWPPVRTSTPPSPLGSCTSNVSATSSTLVKIRSHLRTNLDRSPSSWQWFTYFSCNCMS